MRLSANCITISVISQWTTIDSTKKNTDGLYQFIFPVWTGSILYYTWDMGRRKGGVMKFHLENSLSTSTIYYKQWRGS